MKKLILLTAAFAICIGLTFANNGEKGKKKKCAKGKTCCMKKAEGGEAATSSTTATMGDKPAGKTCEKSTKSCCKSKAKAE